MKIQTTVSKFAKKNNGNIAKTMKALNAAKVKPPKGARWHYSTVSAMMPKKTRTRRRVKRPTIMAAAPMMPTIPHCALATAIMSDSILSDTKKLQMLRVYMA